MTAGEDHDPHCLAPAKMARLLSAAPWGRLVALGDSVAAGIGEPVDGYRDLDGIGRVAEALAASRPAPLLYRNLGERDLRLNDVRERQLPIALDLRPDLVLLAAGGNDALGRCFDEERIERELRALVIELAAHGAQVVTIGLFDLARSGLVPERCAAAMAERFDRLDALTARVAHENGGAHVDNHRHPLAADPGIFAGDRIHANARGHAIAAANFASTLAKLLAPADGR